MTDTTSAADQPLFPTPLLGGFHPDPSITLGPDGYYYLATSSFEYVPGIPIHRSRDLRDWEQVGHVITRASQLALDPPIPNMGVWAPTIRFHDGRYHVIVTIVGSNRGCVVFTAEDPAGPWDQGSTIAGIEGIDPDLAWDDDGQPYVTYSGLALSGENAGVEHLGILQARVDLDSHRALETPRSIWSGTGMQFPEAPHIYHRGEYWYLMIAEGGTERGHCVSIARGPSIEGPFEPCPSNPILSARSTNRSIQNTGHGDLITGPDGNLVSGPDGQDVMVCLGVRTIAYGRQFSPLGRETFATPVDWSDDWPTAAPIVASPRTEEVAERFDFADPAALEDFGWLSAGREPRTVAQLADGALVLAAPAPAGAGADPEVGPASFPSAFIGRRQSHIVSEFSVEIEPGNGSGGLLLRFDDNAYVALTARSVADGVEVTARASLELLEREWTVASPGPRPRLTISTFVPEPEGVFGSVLSDRIALAVDGDEPFVTLDGRYWSTEVAFSFSGRVTGMFASSGEVKFRDFRYRGHD